VKPLWVLDSYLDGINVRNKTNTDLLGLLIYPGVNETHTILARPY
jgi:hypothetical protein